MASDLDERFEAQQEFPEIGNGELGSLRSENMTDLLTNGFAVVSVSDSEKELVREAEIREWMLMTEATLGVVVRHGRSDETGIAEQGVTFFGADAEGQVLHADASYMTDSEVPGVVLIGCVSAADSGGRSTLADARAVIAEMFESIPQEEHSELVTGLTTPGYFVKRGDDDRNLVLPMVSIGEVGFAYRYGDHQYHTVEVLDHARAAVSSLERVLRGERLSRRYHQLKEGEVLMLNNLGMLHGREAFSGGARKLLRLWRGGDGLPLLPYSEYLNGDPQHAN